MWPVIVKLSGTYHERWMTANHDALKLRRCRRPSIGMRSAHSVHHGVQVLLETYYRSLVPIILMKLLDQVSLRMQRFRLFVPEKKLHWAYIVCAAVSTSWEWPSRWGLYENRQDVHWIGDVRTTVQWGSPSQDDESESSVHRRLLVWAQMLHARHFP